MCVGVWSRVDQSMILIHSIPLFHSYLWNILGAHSSGKIGEDPQGIPNNLMPFIAQVCVGRREKLSVFGDDYDTPDGTGRSIRREKSHCSDFDDMAFSRLMDWPTYLYVHIVGVRDYIHVVDLAKGHVAALDKLYTSEVGCEAVNLGTGNGVSVLELVEGMSKATGNPVPYEIAPRRPGDVASVYADPSTAEKLLQWKAELGVTEMCEDTWRWQSTNPYGYKVVEEVTEQ